MAAVEARQEIGDAVQTVDAHSLEVRSQHRFDGSLPAAIDAQLLRDARLAVERLRLQPLAIARYRDLLQQFLQLGRSLLTRITRQCRTALQSFQCNRGLQLGERRALALLALLLQQQVPLLTLQLLD